MRLVQETFYFVDNLTTQHASALKIKKKKSKL